MQVKCALCDFENHINKMFAVHSNGVKTFECSDEKNCKLRQPDKIQRDKDIQKQKQDKEFEEFEEF